MFMELVKKCTIGTKIFNPKDARRQDEVSRNQITKKKKINKVGLPQSTANRCAIFNIYISHLVNKLKSIKGINVCMFIDNVVIWAETENFSKYEV